MTSLAVLSASLLSVASLWWMPRANRRVFAYGLSLAALLVLLLAFTPLKASFIWLGLLGLAGLIATFCRGVIDGKASDEAGARSPARDA